MIAGRGQETAGSGGAGRSSGDALYGRAGGGALQSGHPGVLSTLVCHRESEKGGPHGVHAEAVDHPECDAQTSDPVAHGTGSVCLTAQDSCCRRITLTSSRSAKRSKSLRGPGRPFGATRKKKIHSPLRREDGR